MKHIAVAVLVAFGLGTSVWYLVGWRCEHCGEPVNAAGWCADSACDDSLAANAADLAAQDSED